MSRRTAVQALGAAISSAIGQQDVHDALAQLMEDCRDLLPAVGAGVMVTTRPGVTELLAATSHRAGELELFQVQTQRGPCQECISTGSPIAVTDPVLIRERWGLVGATIVSAGFDAVHAFPIRWNGTTIGGLNIFGRSPDTHQPDTVLGQAFADTVGVLLMCQSNPDATQVFARVRRALAGRAVIEQAKGLLAYRNRSDLGDAYEQLVLLARNNGESLSATAASLIHAAQRP